MTTFTRSAYISTGEHIGFYTLRTMVVGKGVYTDQYVKNLSTDWDKAYDEYELFCERTDRVRVTPRGAQFELNEWGSGGTTDWTVAKYHYWKQMFELGLMPFGKYRNEELSSMAPGYRIWLRGEATDKVENGSKFVARSWKLVVDALEQFVEEDAEFSHQRAIAAKKNEEEKANRQHVGTVGSRIIKTLKCVAKIPYETHYSAGTITVLKDENDNVIKTFGVCPIDQGETKTVKFTVKDHSEWKGEKQTIVNRIALVKETA